MAETIEELQNPTIEELQNPKLYSEISYNQASIGPAILVHYIKDTGQPLRIWYGKIIGKNSNGRIDFRQDSEFTPDTSLSHILWRDTLDGWKNNPAWPNYFQLYKKRENNKLYNLFGETKVTSDYNKRIIPAN